MTYPDANQTRYLGCLGGDNFLGSQIAFVSNKELIDIITCISIDFIQPLLDIVETLLISHIVNYLVSVTATC